MSRYKIVLSFDGDKYRGLNSKKNKGTVAEKLNGVLTKVIEEDVAVNFAIDIETGNSGLDITGDFDTKESLGNLDLLRKDCQVYLPKSIVIKSIDRAEQNYNSKHNIKSVTDSLKVCRYAATKEVMALRPKCHQLPAKINIKKMNDVAKLFIGKHDFAKFATKSKVKKSVKTIETITINDDGNVIEVLITANGFLRGMAENIHNIIMNVGIGQYTIDDVQGFMNGVNSLTHSTILPETQRVLKINEK